MRTSENKLFFYMAVACFLIICLGFGNFYLRRTLFSDEVISPTVHIHGLIFFLWMLFFLLQSALVQFRQTKVHRRIGFLGFVLSLAMLLSAVITTLEITEAGHRGIPGLMFSSTVGFFLLNINAILIFTGLVMAGLYFRKQSDVHKRLMLMATVIGLTPPAISRLPLVSGSEVLIPLVTAFVILFMPVIETIQHKRVHKVYLYSVPSVVFILPPVVEAMASLFAPLL